MQVAMGWTVVLFNLLDNATTFICLRDPVAGYTVVEANPMARWMFESVGLVQGLLLETVLTTGAVAFLVLSPRISNPIRIALLALLIALPAYAAANNYMIMQTIGLGWGTG